MSAAPGTQAPRTQSFKAGFMSAPGMAMPLSTSRYTPSAVSIGSFVSAPMPPRTLASYPGPGSAGPPSVSYAALPRMSGASFVAAPPSGFAAYPFPTAVVQPQAAGPLPPPPPGSMSTQPGPAPPQYAAQPPAPTSSLPQAPPPPVTYAAPQAGAPYTTVYSGMAASAAGPSAGSFVAAPAMLRRAASLDQTVRYLAAPGQPVTMISAGAYPTYQSSGAPAYPTQIYAGAPLPGAYTAPPASVSAPAAAVFPPAGAFAAPAPMAVSAPSHVETYVVTSVVTPTADVGVADAAAQQVGDLVENGQQQEALQESLEVSPREVDMQGQQQPAEDLSGEAPPDFVEWKMKLGAEVPNFFCNSTHGDFHFYEFLDCDPEAPYTILFSHPKDFTPVCTTEMGRCEQLTAALLDRRVKLIGVACDTVEAHIEWSTDILHREGIQKEAGQFLAFPIIADPTRYIVGLLGMLDPEEQDAEGIPLPARGLIVIGPDKQVKLSILYPASTGRNFDEIVRVMDALLLTANTGLCTPADWKQGERVIVPPTISDDEAQERFLNLMTEELPSGKLYLRSVDCPQ